MSTEQFKQAIEKEAEEWNLCVRVWDGELDSESTELAIQEVANACEQIHLKEMEGFFNWVEEKYKKIHGEYFERGKVFNKPGEVVRGYTTNQLLKLYKEKV